MLVERILDAAQEVLIGHGYDGASGPDIDRNEFLYEITTLALDYPGIHDDPMRGA